MNRMTYVAAAITLLGAVACSSNDPSTGPGGETTGDGAYRLTLTGYQPHANQVVQLRVKDMTGKTLGSASGTIPADGNLTLTVPNVLHDGATYHADFFVDNFPAGAPNGTYDAPADPKDVSHTIHDHSWRLEIAGAAAGVSKSYGHDAVWTDHPVLTREGRALPVATAGARRLSPPPARDVFLIEPNLPALAGLTRMDTKIMRTMLISFLSIVMFGCAVSAQETSETTGEKSDELKESSVPLITLPNGQKIHQVTEGSRCFPYEQHFMACSSAKKSASCEKVGNDFQWTPAFDCYGMFQAPCNETLSGYGKCDLPGRGIGGGGRGISE